MIRAILVGLDGSTFSDAAVELGLKWAQRFDCLLVGVGVIDEPTIRGNEPITAVSGHYQTTYEHELAGEAECDQSLRIRERMPSLLDILRVLGLFPVIVLLATIELTGCPGEESSFVHVAGQIEARDVAAGSRIGGRVVAVHTQEGDSTKRGDTLIELDAAEADAAVAAAIAQVAAREAALAKLVHGATEEQLQQAEATAAAAAAQLAMAVKGARNEEIQAAGAALEAAGAQQDIARKEFARIQNLQAQEVASQRQLDQAKAAVDAAEAQYRGAREQRDLVLAGAREEEIEIARANAARADAALAELRRGAREEDIAAAKAARDAAQAELDRTRVAQGEMVIIAPFDGVIESLDVRPGDLLRAGPAVRIVDPENLEVVFYVGATILGNLALQQELDFTADAFGGELFSGRITQIASEGEFTPRNLQTQEERVQQVFGVTVALDSHGGKLRPGMSVTARIPKAGGTP